MRIDKYFCILPFIRHGRWGDTAPEEPQDRKIKNLNPCILDQAWRMLKRLEIPISGVVRREQESLRETVQKGIFPGLFLKSEKPGLCNRMRDGWDADQVIEGGLVARCPGR